MSRRMLQAAGAVLALAVAASPALAQDAAPASAPARTPPPPASNGMVDVTAWRIAYVDESHAVPVASSRRHGALRLPALRVPGRRSADPDSTTAS